MLPTVKILVLVFLGNVCLAPYTDGRMFKNYQSRGRWLTGRHMGFDGMPPFMAQRYQQYVRRKFVTDDDDFEDGSGSGSGGGKSDIEDLPGLINTPTIRQSETTSEKSEGVSNPVFKFRSTSPPSQETKKISTTSKIPDDDQSTSSKKTKPHKVTVSNPNEPLPKNKNTHLKSSLGTPERAEEGDGLSQQTIYIIVGSVSGGLGLILLIVMAIVHFSRKNGQDGYNRNLM
ncbi:uncharacterized protein LOC134236605 isoform X2 [Saccostrea cucullata]|uniref:uncharacterized protein LOC134236605 isoform X2 n=1 Tax=Saccostrea cuccullata TaxID=36930 RepID=UPI002ED37A70